MRSWARGILWLSSFTTVLSSLHPECEYIFQLARDEQRCLREITDLGNLSSSSGCLPVWDAVVCWPRAAVGETVHLHCPAVFSLFKNNTEKDTDLISHSALAQANFMHCISFSREKSTAGGWSHPFPPYHEACIVEDEIPEESYFATVKLIYTVGYGASLLSLSVAVVILLLFRRLHCARNYIHMQLFFTFILKSVAVFVKDATLFSSDDTDHCTLSTAFSIPGRSGKFIPPARNGFPLVCIVLWICSRLYFEDTECWDINEDSPYWWIIKGPIVVSIGVNFLLFMNIIRILVQKLNPRLIQFNNSAQYRRLTKSTLLLIPLFGTHYMVYNFLPEYFNVSLRLCIELCLGSFQGLIVAVLYCFLNQEVQKEIRLRWMRYQEGSYVVVPVGAKGSQMDTPF
ncbi:growth hormone-releasing hormone receptor-like [Sinocyclocheilus rhinocerous]|uniref:growth hormone-releasing hormone receptor-like n=1 Tax=Sinocyclocheilus rhinocerous TaxID=307959 RepID=UPI0007BAC275|nr:PREDICTED: growth hormone-releasing hormone receptor-like [Sinocyclocheilus rhinocerous]